MRATQLGSVGGLVKTESQYILPAEPYTAAPTQTVQSFLARCTEALAHSPGFEVESACRQESGGEMILVQCRSESTYDEARKEIIPLWQTEVAKDEVSLHVVDNTNRGLDFKFAILYQNGTFLTGRIVVETVAT